MTDDEFRKTVEDFIVRWFESLRHEPQRGLIARYMAFQNAVTHFTEWSLSEDKAAQEWRRQLITDEIWSAEAPSDSKGVN